MELRCIAAENVNSPMIHLWHPAGFGPQQNLCCRLYLRFEVKNQVNITVSLCEQLHRVRGRVLLSFTSKSGKSHE